MEVNIYIGFWTLKMKCTQYAICGEVAFKNVRAMIFWKSDGAGRSFRTGPENPDFFVGQLPLPESTSPTGSSGVGYRPRFKGLSFLVGPTTSLSVQGLPTSANPFQHFCTTASLQILDCKLSAIFVTVTACKSEEWNKPSQQGCLLVISTQSTTFYASATSWSSWPLSRS